MNVPAINLSQSYQVLRLACFCANIRWDEVMDMPEGGLPQAKIGVGQWLPGVTFGDFAERTVAGYYHAKA